MKRPFAIIRYVVLVVITMQLSQAQSPGIAQVRPDTAQPDVAQVRGLARLAGEMGQQGTGDRGLALIRQSMALAQRNQLTSQFGYLYYTLGRVHRYRFEFPASEQAYRTAIRLTTSPQQAHLHQQARYALAVVLTDGGNYPAAIRQTFDNVELARQTNNADAETNNLSLLALLYHHQGNTDAELACANQMEAIGKQTNDKWNVAFSNSIRADAYALRGAYSRAITHRERTITAFRADTAHYVYLVTSLISYAGELRMAGRENDVWPVLQEARLLAERRQSLIDLATIWGEYALAYVYRNNPKAAQQATGLSLRYARRGKRPATLLDAINVQVRVNNRLGNHKLAFDALQRHTALRDSINTIANTDAVARLQAQFAWQRDQDSLRQLRQRLTVTQLTAARREQAYQLQQQRQLLFWTVIGGLTLLVAGALFSLVQARRTQRLLTAQNHEIEQQARQVRQLNADKDRLFSIIGHDLRAPVTNLKHQLDKLRFTPSSTTDWQPQVRQLARNADQLFTLTNNLLYWSLIQQNGLRIRPTDLPVMDVLNDVLTQLDGLLSEKHLLIRYLTPDQQPLIRADEQQTAIVIRNILHNAIKFSPTGADICVGIQRYDGRVHLLITDAGPGFAQTIRPAGNGAGVTHTGTGLGLQLATDLMRANHGELQISNATNGGTTVRLTWPLAAMSRNAAPPVSLHVD